MYPYYRCVLGENPTTMEITDECIPRKCVCDWDTDQNNCPSCLNGADEQDCVSIFGHKKYGYTNNYTLPRNELTLRQKSKQFLLDFIKLFNKNITLFCLVVYVK